ncbi:MAG: acyloxyacyl hydrolase, partial [Phaeodactylibacter sp.]|nr:acyloxyacyl hydrolase [Phaeodactylibacter sp.]
MLRVHSIHSIGRALLLGLCLIGGALQLSGQSEPYRLYDLSFHYGKIWRHTPKISYEIPASSWGAQFNIQTQTTGNKEWQVAQHYPLLGLSVAYHALGDPAVLGQALSLIPNFSIRWLDHARWKGQLLIGTGLARLTQDYNAISNPLNNAIGSRLNNVTFFRADLGYQLHPKWELRLGGSFIHFSNAATQLPNLGINLPAAAVGCRYTPDPSAAWPPQIRSYDKKPARRLGLNVLYGMAFRERSVPGGPKFPVYLAQVAGEYRLSKYNHVHLGLEYEFHKEIVQFALHNYTFRDPKAARKGATRWGLMVADELIFGKVGIYLQTGIYLSKASLFKPK